MAKVFINPGHGGSDPGAVANGLKEKDLNLVISLKVNEVLQRHDVTTLMSREKDEHDDFNGLCKDCNNFNPDLAVSIHLNAGGGDGAEVFYSIVGGLGKELAQNILNEIVALGQQSRGIKTKKGSNGDYYGFIRMTTAPAVIVEGAFLDSKDHEIVDTKAEQEAMGVAIAKGILKTLGIAYKEEVKVETKPASNKLYRVQVGAYKYYENAETMLAKVKAAGFKDAFIKEA